MLQNEEGSQDEACGSTTYEMEIIDPENFGQAFLKDEYKIIFNPALSVVEGFYSTSLHWIVHNNFVSYDLGETVFE